MARRETHRARTQRADIFDQWGVKIDATLGAERTIGGQAGRMSAGLAKEAARNVATNGGASVTVAAAGVPGAARHDNAGGSMREMEMLRVLGDAWLHQGAIQGEEQ